MHLMILDDDRIWNTRLRNAFEKRGYHVTSCHSVKEAGEVFLSQKFDCAVLDLKLEDGNSLSLIDLAKEKSKNIKLVVLTGYGNFTTAVEAIKHGAVNYLAKPADIDEIEAALKGDAPVIVAPEQELLSANRVKWEYIQRVLGACQHNISEAARKLKMHRRTLQRILSKHAPRG
jgi:two-component system response regulator RegA